MKLSLSALKGEIAKQKKRTVSEALPESDEPKKYVRRGDSEAELLKAKLAQEKKKKEERDQQKKLEGSQIVDEEKEPEIPEMAIEKVIQKLRKKEEPITLFGEDEKARRLRLWKLENYETQQEEQNEGKQKLHGDNDYKKHRTLEENDPELEFLHDETIKVTKGPADEEESKEIRILRFITKELRHWEKILLARSPEELKTAQGKTTTAQFKQCCRYIKPLFRDLKAKTCPLDVLKGVHEIIVNLEQERYVKANDLYLQLAIGNAPWPMGVTMVGIHERSGREKIFAQNVAHVLNDETQRKYIQSLKRIMTFCQNKSDLDPSHKFG